MPDIAMSYPARLPLLRSTAARFMRPRRTACMHTGRDGKRQGVDDAESQPREKSKSLSCRQR